MKNTLTANASSERPRSDRAFSQLGTLLARHWILLFVIAIGLYAWLPWLAPVFMHLGWTLPGQVIQKIYSTQCHQLPDRSFFLFGPQTTYPLQQIQAAWQNTNDPVILRQFIGSAQMGWKVAWSDRMVAMYSSAWVFTLLYGVFRRRIRPLPVWGLVLLWLPMAIDGGTHFISDLLGGIGAGFRYNNAWLSALTGHAFPQWFYDGNTLGSFNSDMRLLTGVLFGLGLIWFALPIIDESLRQTGRTARAVVVARQDTGYQDQGYLNSSYQNPPDQTTREPGPYAAEKKENLL